MQGRPRPDRLPKRLPRSFFARRADEVARDLLGKTVVRASGPDAHASQGALRMARIVETEAYVGVPDLASHARFGRTRRNEAMWGEPGHAYVYLVYGIHTMLNVVASKAGDPQAVLLRAAEPLDGWDARLSGPGLLARGFGITRADDGADLVKGSHGLRIHEGPPPDEVRATRRIGVDYAGAWAEERLRFIDAASDAVSGPPALRGPAA